MRGDDPWASPDPLGEALHFLRMNGAFYCRSELRGTWGMTMPAIPDSMWFHVVVSGGCRLTVLGSETRSLRPGEFVLVPHGAGHTVSSDVESAVGAPLVTDLPHDYVSDRYAVVRHGNDGAETGSEAGSARDETTLLCGVVRLDHPAAQLLVQALPPLLVVEAGPAPDLSRMHTPLDLVAEEARELRPGGEAVITRLSDVLVIQAIRAWIDSNPRARGGWLGALQDRQIGRVLSLVHKEPDAPWTLVSLAAEAHMSRSAFAARFTAMVGRPAMQYLAQWRMQTAYESLRDGDVTVAELARRSGYQSEAAFSRAFKRAVGVSPGRVRRRESLPLVS